MDDKIVRIPITYKQRKINEHGEGYVPCEVSNRWLQFENTSHDDFVTVDVMTTADSGKDHKITQLLLKKEDILRALNK